MTGHPTVVLATPSWSLNGPNIFSARLVGGLLARGIPARILVTRSDWTDSKPLPPPGDLPVDRLPCGAFVPYSARWRAMIEYLSGREPCIYIPNHDFGHSCVSPKLSRQVTVIGIIHSDDPWHYEHAVRLGRYWNAVVAVSSAIAEQAGKLDPSLPCRMRVIPYGVPVPEAGSSESLHIRRPLRLLYSGRLDQPQKRVLDLPEILRAARDLGIPVSLTVAGSGPAESQLRAACVERAVTDSVSFLGIVAPDSLPSLLASHDVLLLTSGFEGLPIAMLEAMACGCIPVASDIRSGVREIIREGVNGFLVPVGDIRGFAARIADLHREPDARTRMQREARNTIRLGAYNLESMLDSYAELFRQAIIDAESGGFARPSGPILPPPNLPWHEYLPAPFQRAGHYGRRLLGTARG